MRLEDAAHRTWYGNGSYISLREFLWGVDQKPTAGGNENEVEDNALANGAAYLYNMSYKVWL